MINYFISYAILFLIYFISKILFKNLKSKFHEKHQKLAGKELVPLLGGIIMFSYYSYTVSFGDFYFTFFSFLILFLGIFSDNNLLQSPKLRLTLQSVILFLFLYFSDIQINDLRNDFLNEIFSNYYLGLFFTTFCMLVLINGSNFIDGLDGLNLGYFFLIITIILFLSNKHNIEADDNQIKTIFLITSFLLVFNVINYLYLGDSGSYLIGFIFGIFLIELNNYNYFISPYFVALLLWYPAFENLFSIIRKKIVKKDPLQPDNLHFHQLLFNFLKQSKVKIVKKYSNSASSLLIILYNSIAFIIGANFINHTKILLIILLINVLAYLIFYYLLKKKFYHIK